MPKRIAPLLLGLVSAALIAQAPISPTLTAEQQANLKGCADLGITITHSADPYGWGYTIPSPDGTYVAEGHHLGSHGCHDVTIYQCVTQQSSGEIGCGGIFPPESPDIVFARKWVSNDQLLLSKPGGNEIVDMQQYFSPDSPRPKVPNQPLGLSPDGAWQVFNTYRDGMPELYRRRLDGSHVQRLTHSLNLEKFYGWSADGQWLIFDYDNAVRYGLLPVRMRIDGSQLQSLMTDDDLNLSLDRIWQTLDFSPDRKWLLMRGLSNEQRSASQGSNGGIYRLGVPQGGLIRLTNPAFPYWFQSWAPDGRALLWRWTYQEPQQRSFELVDLATAQNTTLFRGSYPEFQRWTDDRKAALFLIHDEKGIGTWFRAELDGSGSRPSDAKGG
jgi:hypothetical protein